MRIRAERPATTSRRRLTSEITGPLTLGKAWRSQTKPRVNGSEFIDLLGGVLSNLQTDPELTGISNLEARCDVS